MNKFESDPTWYNFGNYSGANYTVNGEFLKPEEGETGPLGNASEVLLWAPDMGHDPNGAATNDNTAVDYAEGIYVGYRYYETVADDLGEAGEAWYDDNVVYPFGYGLSYTTFSQEIVNVEGDLSGATGEITVTVRVTNTGTVAGKEVVQIYSTLPYTVGGIDKSSVNLVGFAKTDMLRAGASQTVDITFDVKELASFDYDDANDNDYSGYELEAGSYVLSLRANSHDVIDTRTFECEQALYWDEDGNPQTPNNIFSQTGNAWEYANTAANNWTVSGTDHYLHRDDLINDEGTGAADLDGLSWLLTDDNAFTDEAFNVLAHRNNNTMAADYDNWLTSEVEDNYQNLWIKTEDDMEGLTQGEGTVGANGLYDTILYDMKGVAYDDPAWDAFIDQVTWEEMVDVVSNGGFQSHELETIGKPQLQDSDGPGQLSSGWAWVCEVVIASTWNVELAEEQGRVIGNESMWISGGANNGWYGPALNTHRSPLGGRNFEYYSQDGLQGGLIAAAVVKGATDAGCHVYLKHAFLNEQETNRTGVATFATEQAIREIYAKPFEVAVREGNADGIMSAFNLIGIAPSVSYVTNVQLYSNEWGYRGLSVTDMWGMSVPESGWTGYQMIRGLTQPLGSNTSDPAMRILGEWDDENNVVTVNGEASYTQWYWTRELFKRACYVAVNGNGMDEGFLPYMLAANENITLTAGTAVAANTNVLTAASIASLDEVFGSSGYILTAQGLPAGVTMSADGTLSGTLSVITGGSEYNVTISLQGDNGLKYINGYTVTLDIPVARAANAEEITYTPASGLPEDLTTGTVYSATIGQSLITADNLFEGMEAGAGTYNNGNGYLGYSVSVSGLPAGLSYNAQTGTVSGVLLEPGQTTITVTLAAEHVTATRSGWFGPTVYGTETVYYVYNVTLDVSANASATGTLIIHDGASDITVNVAEGEIADIIENYAPVRQDGYTFVGWSATADGEILTDTSDLEGVTELYAVWQAPAITIIDGYWYIDGVNTGIPATGANGVDGADGQNGQNGLDGVNGTDGADGLGIANAVINDSGELVITYTDGTQVNLGRVVGQDGADGQDGQDGQDAVAEGGGCSGSIVSTAVTVIPALAAVLVLIRKRNKTSDK